MLCGVSYYIFHINQWLGSQLMGLFWREREKRCGELPYYIFFWMIGQEKKSRAFADKENSVHRINSIFCVIFGSGSSGPLLYDSRSLFHRFCGIGYDWFEGCCFLFGHFLQIIFFCGMLVACYISLVLP